MKTNNAAAAVTAYIRVSTEEQQLGPEAQRAALVSWCERNGRTLASVHVDHGVSGADDIERCAGLLAAIDAVEPGGVLLVAKRDRLARDVMKAAMVERLIERKGATIESADGVGNGDGPADALMRDMVNAFAAYERRLISARTKAALSVLKAEGVRLGGAALGWERTAERGADGRQTVVANAAEAATVATIIELRDAGHSLRAIAAELTSRGCPTKKGGAWRASTVRNVLRRAA